MKKYEKNIPMKKILAGLLSALMILSLGACASQTDTAGSNATPDTVQTAETQAPSEATDKTEQTVQAGDSSLADVQARGYFILGLDDSFPPMGYRDEDTNEIVGLDIDLAKAVAAKMNLEVKLQPVVWESIALEINNKNVDVIWNGCTITEERQKVFSFSKPYMQNRQVVVVNKDSSYQTLADLNGKKAGVQAGSSANIALDNNADFKSSLQDIQDYENNALALLDLKAERTDCVIVDDCVFAHYNSKSPDDFRILDQDLGAEEFGIAFHQEANSFREALQAALDEVIADGTATEISVQWFGRDVIVK